MFYAANVLMPSWHPLQVLSGQLPPANFWPQQQNQSILTAAMPGAQLAFGFKNPEYSDAKVLLTTEPRATTRRSHDTKQPRNEVLVCKLVLSGHSDFFKAAFEWDSKISTQPSSKCWPPDRPQVVTMHLANEAMFAPAKEMLRFMYTHQLPDGVERDEVMELLKLADEYTVSDLRFACVRHLNSTPLSQWTPSEMQMLCGVADILANDCRGRGKLAVAARSLMGNLVATFIKLEEVWSSAEQRAAFCSVPYDVAHCILSSPDLVVKSENTVLIAALSWLRSTNGVQATLQERREVLQQVRLLQLSPWFIAALLQPGNFPEAQELLSPEVVGKLVRQLASPPAACTEYQAEDELLQRWAQPRSGALPGMTRDLEFSMGQHEVVQAVLKCRTDTAASESVRHSGYVYFDGLFWSTGVQYSCDADKTVKVWSGVDGCLFVGTEFAKVPHDRFLAYPINSILTVGNMYIKSPLCVSAAGRLGIGRGAFLATVGKDDDPGALLKSCMKGGKMTVQVTLL
jgi:hypothetical protein